MGMRKVFDTNVQLLKYNILKEIIIKAYADDLANVYMDIPKLVSPGPKSEMRCCVYKERAIAQERIKMVMGGDKENPNVIEVIDIACDECPIDGIYVTPACRGCITHKCQEVCPKKAITMRDKKAIVDNDLCIECGKCTKACPYNAIIAQRRPCVVSCKVKAITMDEDKKALINNDKCIMCGACVYMCPFGAISDKSFMLDIISLLRKSESNTKYKVYAVLAPAIASQCKYGRLTQVVTAIKSLGFHEVVEAALGADITLYQEVNEWAEKKLLTTSCCPSFVMYVEKYYPQLLEHVSHSVSPMVETAMLIKAADPDAKVIFIGPCSSKKKEFQLEKTKGAIDSVMSFEELQAFIDAMGLDTTEMEDSEILDNASFYGRIFAKSGGISQGVVDVAKDLGVEGVEPLYMSGVDECKAGLSKLKVGKAEANFFEGMACEGGCVNGALCINRGPRNASDIEKFGKLAKEKTIYNSVKLYETVRCKEESEALV